MFRTSKNLLFGIIAFTLLTGCENGSQPAINPAPGVVESADIENLQVSSDPNNLKTNDINYVPVIKGKQKKILYFKAITDGELSFSTMSAVVGANCDDQKKDANQIVNVTMADFQLSLSLKFKDQQTGKFSIPAKADNSENGLASFQPSISMKAGDEIQVGVELDSPANCDNASTDFEASFASTSNQSTK